MNPYRFESGKEPMSRNESTAWSAIENNFRSAKMESPRRGFANRWMHHQRQHTLADRRRREAWLAFGNGVAILVILFVIALMIFPAFATGSILNSAFVFVSDAFTLVIVVLDVLLTFVQALPLLAWFAIALAFLSLVALWASLFSRMSVVTVEREI